MYHENNGSKDLRNMNCDCNPPLLAAVKKVSNAGSSNQGKEFFICPRGKCKFFSWAGASIPASVHRNFAPADNLKTDTSVRNNENNSLKEDNSAPVVPTIPPVNTDQGSSSIPYSKASEAINNKPQPVPVPRSLSKIDAPVNTAKLTIYKIEYKPPVIVWIGLICANLPALNQFMSKFPADSCFYNHGLKMWIFDFQMHYDSVLKTFKEGELSTLANLEDLPSFLAKGLKTYLKRVLPHSLAYEEIHPNVTEQLRNVLKPHQWQGIRFVISRGGKALIGDEMGCGKTIQAIGVLQHYRQHWPVLIIVPPTLMNQWKAELLTYCSALINENDIQLIEKKEDSPVRKICIMPYSRVDKMNETEIQPEMFGIVIADESHYLKSQDAKRTCVVTPFLKQAAVALCITGTPMLNRPIELYTQLNALIKEIFHNRHAFVERYCGGGKPDRWNPNKLDEKGSSNETEFKALLEGLVMIRRFKAECVDELSDKVRVQRYVDPDPKEVPKLSAIQKKRTVLETKMKELNHLTSDAGDIERIKYELQQLTMEWYHTTGMSKIPAITKEIFQQVEESNLANILSQEAKRAPITDLTGDDEKKEKNVQDEGNNLFEKENDRGGFNSPILMDLEEDIVLEGSSAKASSDLKKRHDETEEEEAEMEGLVDSDVNEEKKSSCSLRSSRKRLLHKTAQRLTTIQELFLEESREEQEISDKCRDLDDDVVDDDDDEVVVLEPQPKKGRKSNGKSQTIKKTAPVLVEETPTTTRRRKIVVFAHHHDVMDAIESALIQKGVKYVRIDGKTTAAKKKKSLHQFQHNNEVKLTTKALLKETLTQK